MSCFNFDYINRAALADLLAQLRCWASPPGISNWCPEMRRTAQAERLGKRWHNSGGNPKPVLLMMIARFFSNPSQEIGPNA